MKFAKLIILLIVIIILTGGGFLVSRHLNTYDEVDNKTVGWQTYKNEQFGYSVDYPGDWTYREFPAMKTGAGFRPLNSLNEIASECITVDARGTAENEYETQLDDYVKRAAIVEIQNYEKLESSESITTTDGLAGYKTTWIYLTFDGQERKSLPITYFENKKIIQMTYGPYKYKTVQVILNDINCEATYNQMISTFKILIK